MKPLASPILNSLGRQVDRPVPPHWFVDTVELWAREWGRHASTRWEPAVGCYVTFFSRAPNDPVLAAVQAGKAVDEGEPFYWHDWSKKPVRRTPFGTLVPGYIPADIEGMGESGVRERLDRANMWSGRGDYRSLDDLADKVVASNEQLMESKRSQLKDGLRDPLRATIRKAKDNAFVGGSGTKQHER